MLTLQRFVESLKRGEIEILLVPNVAILGTWGETEEGLTFSILTICGSMKHAKAGLETMEAALRHSGAEFVISVGHAGWQPLMESHGYEVHPKILMRKKL